MIFNDDYKIIRIAENGKIYNYAQMSRCITTILNSGDAKKNNYSFENLTLKNNLVFDAVINSHGDIIAFSGILNGGRYPTNVYRVLNRYWVSEDYRKITSYQFSSILLPPQLAEFNDKLDVIFVSIEGAKGRSFLSNTWQRKRAPAWGTGWEFVEEGLVKVAPWKSKACYQYISINHRNDACRNIWPSNKDIMPLAEYNILPY